MTPGAALPRLEDLPIPEDVRPDASWSPALCEMADHIGAYDTLRISDVMGGAEVYISRDPAKSPFAGVLDDERAATIAHVYGGRHYRIPTGSKELRFARRAGVVAAVRAKRLTIAEAQRICRATRSHMSFLVNQTDAGKDAAIPPALSRGKWADPRQISMFDD